MEPENVKIACGAASAICNAMYEYHKGRFDMRAFTKYVDEYHPKEIAIHLKALMTMITKRER